MRFRLELSCTRTDAHTITQINNTWYHFMARQHLFNWGRHWAEGEQCQLFGDILARVMTTRVKEFADALGSGKQQQQILWQRLAKQEKMCRGHGLIVPGAEVWDSQASPYHRHSVIKGARLREKTFCWDCGLQLHRWFLDKRCQPRIECGVDWRRFYSKEDFLKKNTKQRCIIFKHLPK